MNPCGRHNENFEATRVGADETTGAPGWDIDDIAVTGLTNTPFAAIIGNVRACTTEDR